MSPRKTALIAGITGQDGAYLAHYLLGMGYRVVGTSRDAQMADLSRLERLGIAADVELMSLAPNDFRSVLKVVSSAQPQEIYNLAGQTSVGLSFDQPVECMESISVATLNLLEVIRYLAYWQVATYREAYSMYACTGILANHESPLRPKRFVTQKIIEGVRAIKAGRQTTIQLGNLYIWRDWGWAADYVQAMHRMLQAETPGDYLIASGTTTSLQQFAQAAFAVAGLDLAEHLESVEALKRPADLAYSAMNPCRIQAELGWASRRPIREIVEKMYNDELL